jgi:hypothetical protein
MLARRMAKLESQMIPRRKPRIILRFEDPGSERFPAPTQEELEEENPVLTIRFVSTRDGGPVEDEKETGT